METAARLAPIFARATSSICLPFLRRQETVQTLHFSTSISKDTNEICLNGGLPQRAERLESERQTVRIVMSNIDAVVSRLIQDELIAAAICHEGRHAAPAA